MKTLPLPVVVIDAPSNALPSLVPFAPFVPDRIKAPPDPVLWVVQPDGAVLRSTAPRS